MAKWIVRKEHYFEKKQIHAVYKIILDKLQELMPDFVVDNAVAHYDEASPHMHVVGVLQGELRDNAKVSK